MIPDKLLINLKIISKIQKNGRIARSYDGIISLENDVFYQSIKRFVSNDSRRQAIFEINSVITECVDILQHILNSKHMNKNFSQSDEYIKACENINLILHEMELARCGVENLKFTYQNDPNIVSQIDIVILKINTTLLVLDMNNNIIGDEGAKLIAESLKINTTLKILNLSNNNIGDEGAMSLATAKEQHNIEINIALASNQISIEVIVKILTKQINMSFY